MPDDTRSLASCLVRAGSVETQEFDWGSICWLINAERGNSETMTCGRVVMKPGESNPHHRHTTCDEILCLLSGELEHYADDMDAVRMGPGDMIVLPAGIAHHATCVGDGDAEMIVVYSSAHRDMQAVDAAD